MPIIAQVTINFLPVGHTHEDVDQFFSRISVQLRKNGAESIPDLLHATEISMEPNPKTYFMESMFDVRSWIEPHLNEIHGHRDPHCFKFLLNEENKAVMYFRNWTSNSWCPQEKATIVLKSLPEDIPQFAIPSLLKVEPVKLEVLDIPNIVESLGTIFGT